MEIGKERNYIMVRRATLGVFGERVQLDAIARRENHRFGVRKANMQLIEGVAGLFVAEREPLAHFDWRVVMAAPGDLEFHRAALQL
jgi:hypothetical protein